jgi:methionine synthase I (cobalamin-dependent)
MRPAIAMAGVLCFAGAAGAQSSTEHAIVPDATTAIAIARAALTSAYGAKAVVVEEPLVATDKGDRWLVDGTFKGGLGGTTPIEIAKSDGRIQSMTAYQ